MAATGGGVVVSIVMTVLSSLIVIGLLFSIPGLGILLAIMLTPFLWVLWRVTRKEAIVQRTTNVAASVTTAIAAIAAGAIAFFASCWGGFYTGVAAGKHAGVEGEEQLGWGIITGLVLGPMCAVVVAVWIFEKLLPKSQGDRRE
ncbi:MAG: hypothetical protein L0215_12845 [Gemmataceae bacterium]|nr:hypothetical protein [Gemmataceae bacterium]